MILKHGREAGFDRHANLEIRTRLFKQGNARCRQDAISQRAQADNARARTSGKLLENGHGTLFFDQRLIDQHNWYIIPDGIDAMALSALQTTAVRFEFERFFADRANQDFEQIGPN